jgi:CRISPR-associated endoribonuclease Cas6
MNWLYAIVLRLVATRPGAVPAHHGEQARAALMQIIRHGDQQLAGQLHDHNMRKPYTVSLIAGQKRGKDGALHFGPGDEATWRFTLLWEPAFDAVLNRYLLREVQPHVRIGAVDFHIVEALANNGSHPECGSLPVVELEQRWLRDAPELPTTLTLSFHTPTAFNIGKDGKKRLELLPIPRLIFSTLRKTWRGLSGYDPGDAFDQWVDDNVQIDRYKLHTEAHRIKRQRVIPGFVGNVTFRIRDEPEPLAFLHLLADLSFWTGLGYQTGAGMGQVRIKHG